MSSSSSSMMLKKISYVNGSSIIVTNGSQRGSHLHNGIIDSCGGIQRSGLGSHQALTQSVLNASIRQLLMSTSDNWGRFLMRRRFHGSVSTTWMRKVISVVVDGECKHSNISFPVIEGPSTSFNADGSSLKPGFIFPGKEHHPEWFDVDDNIRYVHH